MSGQDSQPRPEPHEAGQRWQTNAQILAAVVVVLVAALVVGAWLSNQKEDRISRCYDLAVPREISVDYRGVIACLRREGVSDAEIRRQFVGE